MNTKQLRTATFLIFVAATSAQAQSLIPEKYGSGQEKLSLF